MSVTHSFSVELATQVGVEAAIMLNYFGYWHQRNETAGHNLINGRYWTYNKLESLVAQFPYWTEKQMRTILTNMERTDLIITAHHGGANRTKWYALSDAGLVLLGLAEVSNQEVKIHLPKRANATAQTGESNCPNGQMQLPKRANATAQTGKSIYKDTVTNTVANQLQTQEKNAAGAEAPVLEKKEGEGKPVKPKKPKAPTPLSDPPPPPTIVTLIRRLIEQQIEGYYWSGKDGSAAKAIADKLRNAIAQKHGPDSATDDKVMDALQVLVHRTAELPAYYQFTDLPTLNSKFNEIITQLRKSKSRPEPGSTGRPVAPAHRSQQQRRDQVDELFSAIDDLVSQKQGG